MCIRDRALKAVPGVSSAAVNLATESAEIKGIAPADALIRACLLYTSDAADERSSVDLGGRRIIKKKTMSAIRGRSATDSEKTTKRDDRVNTETKEQKSTDTEE